ncbi:hypothetical protein KUCAC02_037223, partial [Chaenocephalus aceratus]
TMASPDSVRVVAMVTTPLLAEDLLSWTLIYPGFCREDYAVYGPREWETFPLCSAHLRRQADQP